MRPQLLVVAAGIASKIGKEFVAKSLKTDFPITAWVPLDWTNSYTASYSDRLYKSLATELQKRDSTSHLDSLDHANLVLLYIDKNDGSETMLFKKFSPEALLAPLQPPDIVDERRVTGNQRRQVANRLIRKSRRAIRRAQTLLAVIAEEVTNRDNKTCLLLPPKNFGQDIGKVISCVHDACLNGQGEKEFKKRLEHTFQSLHKKREGGRTYVVGRSGTVFKSPSKAGARHGSAPAWGARGHDSSCVIRSRVRFGASYDPKFHYDCDIGGSGDRCFPSCHGFKSVPPNRHHVNISPNDNIR